MHGLKTPAFLRSSRPASPAPHSPASTPVVAPVTSYTPVAPLELSNELPVRRPLAKLHLPSAFRRASPSPSPAPLVDKPSAGANYLDALALRISEAAGKAIASPTPAHNSDGLLLGGRRPLPAGRGKVLGQLIDHEIKAAAQGGNDLLRASLRALHRPLNVLLSNVGGLLAPLVVTPPTHILAPLNGWVGNGAPQAHALGLATLVGELLDALDALPTDCAKVGGEGLRSIKEGLEGVVKRVVNPVLTAVRTELGTLVDALESTPESSMTGKKDKGGDHPALCALQSAMPCAIRVHARIASVPGSAVRGALAACEIAIVWRAMVALAHRKIEPPRPAGKPSSIGKANALGKSQSSGSIGSSGLTKRLTPPNTPPAGRFGLLLPPSRPPTPPNSLSPAAQLAHDARIVVGLLDALPKPAGDDAREAVVEAFDALRALAELFSLLCADPIDHEAIVNLVDGDEQADRDELPALVVLPALLKGKSVTCMLGISEAEYRERCLAGFGRAEASEEVVLRAVLAKEWEGPEWVREWVQARSA